jgi:hypothetical protein
MITPVSAGLFKLHHRGHPLVLNPQTPAMAPWNCADVTPLRRSHSRRGGETRRVLAVFSPSIDPLATKLRLRSLQTAVRHGLSEKRLNYCQKRLTKAHLCEVSA